MLDEASICSIVEEKENFQIQIPAPPRTYRLCVLEKAASQHLCLCFHDASYTELFRKIKKNKAYERLCSVLSFLRCYPPIIESSQWHYKPTLLSPSELLEKTLKVRELKSLAQGNNGPVLGFQPRFPNVKPGLLPVRHLLRLNAITNKNSKWLT